MNDLSLGFRRLAKSPGFTTVAVLTLALGIGLNAAIFAAIRAAMVRPLPYPDSERLVEVFGTSLRSPRENHSVPNILDVREQNGVCEFLATFTTKPFNLAEPGQPAETVQGMLASGDFFQVLGVRPAMGRTFDPDDDRPGHNQVVVLDHHFWIRRFAGDPDIVGRSLRMDGESVTVIGVMPPAFRDRLLAGAVSVWRPIAFTDEQKTQRGHHFLKAIGRLRSGVGLTEARVAFGTLSARLQSEHPDSNTGLGFTIVPLAEAKIPPQGRRMLWAIMALAGFVLLIACANLANLQFARTASRSRELAIRGALGAPRLRVFRQLLTESLLVAGLGAACGLIFARLAIELLRRLLVFEGESPLVLTIDWRVFLFALAASTTSGLAFGLLPAWFAARSDVSEALKQGARGNTRDPSRHRSEHAFIVAEVALALMLLAGAGLVVDGLRAFSALDPGWRVDRVVAGYLTLPEARYPDAPARRTFAERLEQKLKALAGVQRAAVCWNPPLRQFNVTSTFQVDGRDPFPPGHEPVRFVNGVTPDYFDTLGMRLLQGRGFTSTDRENRPAVVLVNESLARSLWPDRSAVGQRIQGEEIVGVVNDVRFPANPADTRTTFQTYRPLSQAPSPFLAVVVQGTVEASTLRRAVADLDPDQSLERIGPVREDIDRSIANWAIGGKLLTAFAVLGLSLAALGVYGVISGYVARRSGEIGVRMALGAQARDILWLVLRRGLRLAGIGVVLGLAGAAGIVRILVSVLPGLPSTRPLVIATLVAMLVGIVLAACGIPARRAMRVSPTEALRIE